MYRTNLDTKDKGGALAAVAAVHVGLFFMLLQLSGRIDLTEPQRALEVFDIIEAPPPPEEPPPVVEKRKDTQKPKEKEGAASPKNIRSKATEVVAPRPEISLPVPVPMAVTRTPNSGTEATQGASNVVGPGTGAGGVGTGTGSGGSGNGTGGGGDGGYAIGPQLVTPRLTGRDFPRELIQGWPGRATIFLRLRIDTRGNVIDCSVPRGTGIVAIDDTVCNIARARLHFRPAVNRAGVPVASWVGYAQQAPR